MLFEVVNTVSVLRSSLTLVARNSSYKDRRFPPNKSDACLLSELALLACQLGLSIFTGVAIPVSHSGEFIPLFDWAVLALPVFPRSTAVAT